MVGASSPKPVTVLLFARFAELLEREAVELDPATVPSVRHLIDHLRRLPGGDLLPPDPLVAVNRSQVRGDAAIGPGDEVALLPPLAGG
jgi:molybdopterin converting factor small subunit